MLILIALASGEIGDLTIFGLRWSIWKPCCCAKLFLTLSRTKVVWNKRLTVHLAEIWVPSAEGKGKKNNFLIMAGHWAENITTTLSIKRLVPILQCVHNDWKLPYLVILLLLMCRHFNVNCTALKTHTSRRHFLQRPLGGAKRAFYHLPHSHLSLFLDCLPSLSVCYKPCNSSLSLNFVAFCAKT